MTLLMMPRSPPPRWSRCRAAASCCVPGARRCVHAHARRVHAAQHPCSALLCFPFCFCAAAAPLRPLTRTMRHCLQDGALLWEDATYSSASGAASPEAAEHAVKPVLLLGKVGERETVATLSRGRVQVRRAASPRIHAPDFGSDCRLALARPQVRSAADGSLIWDTDASSHASGALLSTCVRCLRGSLPPAADALALPSRRASGWRHHPTEARCMQLA